MIKRFCAVLAIAAALTCTQSYAAPAASEVSRMKFVNNNNIPSKILVVHSYDNGRFVKDLFNVVKEINVKGQLTGKDVIKLHIVPSSSNPISALGISAEDAKKYVEVNDQFSSSDIWMQDCMEMCSAVTKDGKLVPAVFDSSRGRGLGRLPRVLSQMWDMVFYKNPSAAQAHGDYGGNLEVTPFDDILVVGDTITPQCKKYLEDNGYKGRMFLGSTKWLTVGHIDEYLSFIPTANAPGGYTLVKADPIYALDMIRSLPESEFDKVTSYDRSFLLKVKRTLEAQLNDPNAGKGTSEGNFIAMNYAIADIIEQTVANLKDFVRKTTKDTDRDIEEVAWPALFEGRGTTSPNSCHAFLPGVVNLLVIRDHLVVPATHIPAFDKAIEARLKSQGNKVHFVDDTPYHTSMGEIHCGTNALRDPNRTIVTTKQLEKVQKVRSTFKELHHER